jgi:hypothetical protein
MAAGDSRFSDLFFWCWWGPDILEVWGNSNFCCAYMLVSCYHRHHRMRNTYFKEWIPRGDARQQFIEAQRLRGKWHIDELVCAAASSSMQGAGLPSHVHAEVVKNCTKRMRVVCITRKFLPRRDA